MAGKKTNLARWLRREMDARGLTQNAAAVYAGVAAATLSDILTKNHIPKVEILLRLADYFETPRVEVLCLAGHLQRADEMASPGQVGVHRDNALVPELLAIFRQLPHEWREAAVSQLRVLLSLSRQPPTYLIGDDGEPEEGTERGSEEQRKRSELA